MRNRFGEQLERLHVEMIQMGALCEDAISAAAQAADIAELTRFVRLPDGPGRQRIEEMSKAVIRMVTDSVDSFVKRDLELAREVCREDDQVDDLFNQVKKELIGLIAADADSGELWLDLIMVAKYLERIGDHATNVAEWVEYSITGNHPSNN